MTAGDDLNGRLSAALVLERHLALFASSWMRTLEASPVTLAQTEAILAGGPVEGVDPFDRLQMRNFLEAAEFLIKHVRAGRFRLDLPFACSLHARAAREDALAWGVLRSGDVTHRGIGFRPPAAADLPRVWAEGVAPLGRDEADPRETAARIFLLMARSQFFYDANKRTAALMMNGFLMSRGLSPVIMPASESARFHRELGDYYESGDPARMLRLLAACMRTLPAASPDL